MQPSLQGNSQQDKSRVNPSLGNPPESAPLPEDQYSVIDTEEGIYIEFNIPKETWQTRVYIDGMGQVAEEVCDNSSSSNYNANFFFPFVEAEKTYKIRLVFYRDEDKDGNGFVIDYKNDDGVVGWFETELTAGPESKGEVRFTSKGKISVNKKGDFRFTQKPTFTNEHLLDGKWAVDIGVVEGISWEHGAERKTKWHSIGTPIPCTELTKQINLYQDQNDVSVKDKYSIDFICVRPVMSYEYNGKEYKYQWESFAQDLYYPPRNPDGIYFEFDLPFPKSAFSRCDVIIDGIIGKVAEEVCVDKNKASFFYPFVAADEEYTVRFSFKKHEPVDSEGFVIPIHGSDTLLELTKTVTAGPRAKGEVRLLKTGWIHASPDYDINFLNFKKPEFENEYLLGNNWQIEAGLMEGISWEHGTERRTYWHCSVIIPKELQENSNLSLRDLKPLECNDHDKHEIDCLCVRPIMSYEYGDKTYNYMWNGFTSDVYYPPRTWFEEINVNNSSQVNKIRGTWKAEVEKSWYENKNWYWSTSETLKIDSGSLTITTNYEIRKHDGTVFTDTEKQNILDEQEHPLGHFFTDHQTHADWDFYTSGVSNDNKVLYKNYVCQQYLNNYFDNDSMDNGSYYKLALYKDGKTLRINQYYRDFFDYYDYYKQ